MAAKLVREGSHEAIRHCVREFDELMRAGSGANLENPPGLLVKNIRERRAADKAGRRQKHSAVERRDYIPHELTSASVGPVVSEAAKSGTQLEAIRGYLCKLSLDEREALEAEAVEEADGVRRDGYRRAESTRNSRLLAEYRNAIIESHVLRLLGGGSG
jgi:hypothetical protein